MGLFGVDYLSKEALSNLKHYKYGAIDKSLITKYIMKPYWDFAVTLFPLWIAPNLITLMGFIFILINFVLVLIYVPDLVGPAPSWVYFAFGIFLHLYSTFDNVDGKQARRTGSSSPLGELFDHGVDALNCSFGSVVQAAAMGLGHSWYSMVVPFLIMGAFFPTTWEEYHTGFLHLGIINGPTEGILLGIGLMFISGIFGPQIYMTKLSIILGNFGVTLPSFIPQDLLVVDILVVSMSSLLFFFQLPQCIISVYQTCKEKNKSFLKAFMGLFFFFLFFTCCYFWISSPDSIIISQGYTILFLSAVGICFGRMNTKVITAYVTKMPFPYLTIQAIPLVFACLNFNSRVLFGVEPLFKEQNEVLFLWGYLIFNLIAYGYWTRRLITSFCKELKIKPFTIPKVK